ncbi:MAG TPA: hypothetical protein VF212_12875 [Longimicrobiales bacterium]
MGPAWHSLQRSPVQRRRLTLALATAEERLIEAHAEAARDFLRVTREEVAYERGLEIFFRLTGTPDRIREAVAVQALASLAEEPEVGAPMFDLSNGVWGLVQGIARRLRGRRAESLRLRVDRAAGRARDKIKGAYLHGASLLVDELKTEVEPAEAVQVYIDALEIGQGWRERIFHEAVASMGQLERPAPRAPEAADGQAA